MKDSRFRVFYRFKKDQAHTPHHQIFPMKDGRVQLFPKGLAELLLLIKRVDIEAINIVEYTEKITVLFEG